MPPLPTPNEDEQQDDFVSRCMANDVMNADYPDAAQRSAVCESQWEGRAFSRASFAKSGNEIELEVFATGVWNGLDFTGDDVKLIAHAFSNLKEYHDVPVKFGHNEEQPMTDGQPALGWVENVWVKGETLVAKLVDVPDIVYNALKKKLYKKVSIELDMGVEHKGTYYPWVLSGVALLGADIPAVNVLADLQAYMGRDGAFNAKERAFFTKEDVKLDITHRRDIMGMEELQEEIKTLKAQYAAQSTANAKLVEENQTLKDEAIERKAKFRAIEEADKVRQQAEERKTLEKRLDAMVEGQKIAPFTREEFMRDYDEAGDKKTVIDGVERLEKVIESNPAYFGVEQARMKANKTKRESEMDASTIVTERTREYMAKHGEKNFAVAKKVVLSADSELANRYVKGED